MDFLIIISSKIGVNIGYSFQEPVKKYEILFEIVAVKQYASLIKDDKTHNYLNFRNIFILGNLFIPYINMVCIFIV